VSHSASQPEEPTTTYHDFTLNLAVPWSVFSFEFRVASASRLSSLLDAGHK